jgi:hypothetical protein
MVRKWIKNTLCVTVGAVTLTLAAPQQSQAQTNLEIVFIDSLWGGGIGAVSGLALWAWKDQKSAEATSMIARGAAVGVFGGVMFGLYEIGQGGSVQDDMFNTQQETTPSIFDYNRAKHTLAINPTLLANSLIQQSFSGEHSTTLPLLRISF